VLLLVLSLWLARSQGRLDERVDDTQDDLHSADVVAKERAKAKQLTADELEAKGSKWPKRSWSCSSCSLDALPAGLSARQGRSSSIRLTGCRGALWSRL